MLDWPAIRRIRFQRVVDAVLVVVAHVISDQPVKMSFVQPNDMVEHLAPATSNPPLRDTVLPGCLDTRPLRRQTRGLQECDDRGIELRVAVQDDITIWTRLGKRLPQLLDDPLRRRVSGHVEMQNPTPPMLDDEEAVEQLEDQRGHGEEVEGNDQLTVILEESLPAPAGINAAPQTAQIPRHGSFGNLEAELLKLSVDLGGSPVQVLLRQASDQNTNLAGDLQSATAWPGSPPPIEPKPGAMPADHGLGLHDDKDVGPPGPHPAEGRPEQPVKAVQLWARPFAFEHGNLLSEGEDLNCSVMLAAEEDADSGQERSGEFEHEPYVVA